MSDVHDSVPELSVVIPCYNEGESLHDLFAACRNCLTDRVTCEFIVIDNGSTDNSREILAALLQEPQNSAFRMVVLEKNQGYGYGIMQGVRIAKGDVVAWTHADLQTDPVDVIQAYTCNRQALHDGSVLVKGRRKGRSWFDAVFTAGMSLITLLLIGETFIDINAQPKIFNRSLLEKMESAPDDFSLDTFVLYIAKTNGLRLVEYPVIFDRRKFGTAKGGGTMWGKMKLIKRTLLFLRELRRKLKTGIYNGDRYS